MLKRLQFWHRTTRDDLPRLKDRAASHVARRRYKRAAAVFEKLVTLEPTDAHLALRFADTLRLAGQTEHAINEYYRATTLHARAGELAKAVAVLNVLLDLSPLHDEGLDLLTSLRKQQDLELRGRRAQAAPEGIAIGRMKVAPPRPPAPRPVRVSAPAHVQLALPPPEPTVSGELMSPEVFDYLYVEPPPDEPPTEVEPIAVDAGPAPRLPRGALRSLGSLLLVLGAAAGCVEGEGVPCTHHSDCTDGLVCASGACGECPSGKTCLGIDLESASCEVADDALAGVTTLRLRLEGDGQVPRVRFAEKTAGSVLWEDVAPATGLRVTVEGLAAADAIDPISHGTSAPFDIVADQPTRAAVAWLRRPRAFTPAHTLGDGARCNRMLVARAGHSATLLPSGQLLLVGGDTMDPENGLKDVDSGELFDPRRGTFDWLPDSLAQARSGHTATLLNDGRVLVTGGEATIGGKRAALGTAEIWDPAKERWSQISMRIARRGHTATMLPDGRVFLAGGDAGDPHLPLASTEIFDPTTRTFTMGPKLSRARRAHSAAVFNDRLVIAGGFEADEILPSVEVFDVKTLAPATPGWRLGVARREPHLVPFSEPFAGLLALGGPETEATSETAWDFFADTATPPRGALALPPIARTGACAAGFEGGALVAGGRDTNGTLLSSVEIYAFENVLELAVRPPVRELAQPRARAACTTLADGTVAVSGGESVDGTSFTLELFQP